MANLKTVVMYSKNYDPNELSSTPKKRPTRSGIGKGNVLQMASKAGVAVTDHGRYLEYSGVHYYPIQWRSLYNKLYRMTRI